MRNNADFNPFALTDSGYGGGKKRFNRHSFSGRSKRSHSIDIFHSKAKRNNHESLGLLINRKLAILWLVFIFFGISVLLSRTAFLQIVEGDYFSVIAEGNRIRIVDLKAPRGVIYDRNNKLLVENIASFSLAAIPVDLPASEEELRALSVELDPISDLTEDEIFETLDKQSPYSYQPVILQENLTSDQAIMVEILSGTYPGVKLRSASLRNYLFSENQQSLSHVIGYSGRIEENKLDEYLNSGYLIDDYVGKTGVEVFYESTLKGDHGKEQVEVDAIGQSKEVLASQEPVSGKNLVLTIDSELQEHAEKTLRNILDTSGKKRGAVIVLDPNNGEILALVSLPAFDGNLFSSGISHEDFSRLISDENRPLFSRAVSGEYPSGSTFKMIVGAAALEEELINEWTSFQSVGGIGVGQWFFPDWKAGGHGWTNVVKAISESVNTFFYIIGGGYQDFTGLGVARIADYAKEFGLDSALGVDLPNEGSGFFPTRDWKEEVKKERWYIGDTYNLSIGQGDVLVTPLQVASWTSVFVNNGVLYRPHVVKEILDSENNSLQSMEPEVINQNFISQNNLDIIKKGLRQSVVSGSGQRLSNLPFKAGSKTGTAQWSSKHEPHAWVTAFGPYDEPQIVVTALVEEGEGGTITAMPVVYDIMKWWGEQRIEQ